MSNKINIAITGTGSLIGQAVIKSIRNSNLVDKLKLIGFDYFNQTVGAFWCTKNYLLPDLLNPNVTQEQWLTFMMDHLKKHDIKLLFVGVDFELPILARYKDKIEQECGTKVIVSSEEVINIGDDKYLTYQFLKDNGLYYPKSYLPNEIDTMDLTYPVIIKPRKGARSVGVSSVNSKEELVKAIALLKEPVIQEKVGNDEVEFTCGVLYLNDTIKASIALRRSLKAGNTFISHYKKDFPEIITTYIHDIAKHLKPFGACNFQMRLDDNGIPKLFEINPRHSGTTYIRSLFGYREIEYIINSLLFDIETPFDLREGTVVRYYDEFFVEPT